MDIEAMWKNIEPVKRDELLTATEPALDRFKSNSPLEKIKRNMAINLAWAVVIIAFYGYILFSCNVGIVRVAIGIVAAFSVWAAGTSWKLYRQLNGGIAEPKSLLAELEYHYNNIYKWNRNQQVVALFFYPVSIAGGFLWGGVMGSGKPVEAFMSKPFLWWVLIASIVVLTPLCYLLTQKMFRYGFGKHMDNLKKNIDELKSGV